MNNNVSSFVLLAMATILVASEATYLDDVVSGKELLYKPTYSPNRRLYPAPVFRKLTPEYNDALFELQARLFPECQYTKEEFFNDMAKHDGACLLLVRPPREIVAFVLTNPDDELKYNGKRTGYINLLGVAESYRRHGAAKSLLNAIQRVLKADFKCKYISLHTRDNDSNTAALEFYRKSGYLVAERIPNYFPDYIHSCFVNAVYMVRPIDKDWDRQELPQLTYFSKPSNSTSPSTSKQKSPGCLGW